MSVLREQDLCATVTLSPLTSAHHQLVAPGSGLGRHCKAARWRCAQSLVSARASEGVRRWRLCSALFRPSSCGWAKQVNDLGFLSGWCKRQFWSPQMHARPSDWDMQLALIQAESGPGGCTKRRPRPSPWLGAHRAPWGRPNSSFGPELCLVLGQIQLSNFRIRFTYFFGFLFCEIRKLANGPIKKFCCGIIWIIMFKIQWHFGPILVSFHFVIFPFSVFWRLEKLVIGPN
jgi:hypothetical protein